MRPLPIGAHAGNDHNTPLYCMFMALFCSLATVSVCAPCPLGSYAPTEQDSCTYCDSGTYASIQGATVCSTCLSYYVTSGVASFTGTGTTTADCSITCTGNFLLRNNHCLGYKTFSAVAADQQFNITPGMLSLFVKMWAAGGGGSIQNGETIPGAGGGGYVEGVITGLTPATQLTIVVGQGGFRGGTGSSGKPYGGGGERRVLTCNTHSGGAGGGRSEINIANNPIITAGASGGAMGRTGVSCTSYGGASGPYFTNGRAGSGNNGGEGGGTKGGSVCGADTNACGGAGTCNTVWSCTECLGKKGIGGAAGAYGAGGGSGYYGAGGTSWYCTKTGAGSGSSYWGGFGSITVSAAVDFPGAGSSACDWAGKPPGNANDPYRPAGVGYGGNSGATDGGPGFVIVAVMCDIGYYIRSSSATTCYPCTNGGTGVKYTNSGAANTCAYTCGPGYFSSHDGHCAQCPAGTSNPTPGMSSCSTCPAGSYCTTGAINPVVCVQGSLCLNGSAAPQPCPAGSICVSPSSIKACNSSQYCPQNTTVVSLCPGGFQCPTPDTKIACNQSQSCLPGSTQATPCPASFYCPNASVQLACPPRTTCAPGVTAPVSCPDGQICLKGSSAPVACPAGQFCVGANIATCPTGFFCAPGSSQPVPCNSTSGSLCLPGASAPMPCPAGSYCPTPAFNVSCTLQSYCPPGSTTQRPCAPGFFCSNTTTTQRCSAGTLCLIGTTDPQPCPVNFYCPDPTTVLACPQGRRCLQNSTSPLECEANTFCPTPSTQLPCPPPTVSPPNASSFLDCTCPQGTFGTIFNATRANCTQCPKGDVCTANAAKQKCNC